ncbi:MAG: hypothetical protein VKP57_06230 [Candidatus Sericytochromatia bacterium]|nr:hypothetical protein [Candidatus Sericytochromatia bacterium]
MTAMRLTASSLAILAALTVPAVGPALAAPDATKAKREASKQGARKPAVQKPVTATQKPAARTVEAPPPARPPVTTTSTESTKPQPADREQQDDGVLSDEVGTTPLLKGAGTYTHRILWSQRAIRVMGIGVAPDRGNVHVRRTRARIFALEDGFRTLRSVMGRVAIDSAATMADLQLDNEVRDRVHARIQEARVLNLDYLPDGSAQMELLLPLYGSDGLAGAIGPLEQASGDLRPASVQDATASSASATESSLPGAPWTGLLIDARSLGAKPALWPRIRTQSGETTTIPVPSWFREREAATRLVGDRPLTLKARRAVGDHPCDLMLDAKDAERAREVLAPGRLPVAILL